MFKIIAIIMVIAIIAILGIAMSKPANFHVERSAAIKAPPEKIFPLINDFKNWAAWSPYEKLDPAMKKTLSGATSGKGAVYAWEGNSKAGAGRMEITDAALPSKVTIKLDFVKPFEGHNVATFTLEPKGDVTNVTWAMDGPAPFVTKIMQVFFSLDNMIGKDFAEGLANLKAFAEK